MTLWNGIPIIDDSTNPDEFFLDRSSGRCYPTGAVPRDYSVQPESVFASPDQMSLIPDSEWDARIDEQEATRSSLGHMYLPSPDRPAFVNLNQEPDGYCWAYSTGHAVMMARLRDGLPIVRLNPHSVAAIIMNGANRGAWCGLSGEFAGEHGIAPEGNGPGQWPLRSRDISLDTPAMRESMARYKTTEDWIDLGKVPYQRDLTRQQLATCLLNNQPCPVDFSWWGHSVCAIRWVRVEPGSYGLLILNSWKGWGKHGLAVLQGDRANPMGAISIRVTRA